MVTGNPEGSTGGEDENPFPHLPDFEEWSPEETLEVLTSGEMTIEGRVADSSNATFVVTLEHDLGVTRAVYKPLRGERPLWDFPPGLHRREVAAWELSRHLEWDLVPPTVARDGTYGEGSVQLFVPADFSEHHFTLVDDPAHGERLRLICAFDIIANNTDRKSGHCLAGRDGRVWAIDHGLCFSAEFKLRTVIWEFSGEPLPPRVVAGLTRLAAGLPESVTDLLDRDETVALYERVNRLLESGVYPIDETGRRYPWPLV